MDRVKLRHSRRSCPITRQGSWSTISYVVIIERQLQQSCYSFVVFPCADALVVVLEMGNSDVSNKGNLDFQILRQLWLTPIESYFFGGEGLRLMEHLYDIDSNKRDCFL